MESQWKIREGDEGDEGTEGDGGLRFFLES